MDRSIETKIRSNSIINSNKMKKIKLESKDSKSFLDELKKTYSNSSRQLKRPNSTNTRIKTSPISNKNISLNESDNQSKTANFKNSNSPLNNTNLNTTKESPLPTNLDFNQDKINLLVEDSSMSPISNLFSNQSEIQTNDIDLNNKKNKTKPPENNESLTEEELALVTSLFPDLHIAPPMPLRISPLVHLPHILNLYSILVYCHQEDKTSQEYQRKQYITLIVETVLEILRECLERQFEDVQIEDDIQINEKKIMKADGWKRLKKEDIFSKDSKSETKSLMDSSKLTIRDNDTEIWAVESHGDIETSISSRAPGSVRGDDYLSMEIEYDRMRKRLHQFTEASKILYKNFQQRDKKHLSRILYNSNSNRELFQKMLEEKLTLILERYSFTIQESMRKKKLEHSNIPYEYQATFNSLTKELLALRNLSDGMKERINEITQDKARDTQIIKDLTKSLEEKDKIITELKNQNLKEIELLKEQIYKKNENLKPVDYDPNDYILFIESKIDRNLIESLQNQLFQQKTTFNEFKQQFENEKSSLIKEKYEALNAQKKHIFYTTNMSAFNDIIKPVSSSFTNVNPKHFKVVTTQNMELVREKYEAMRSMLEQMKSELYVQFEEKESFKNKLDEIMKKEKLLVKSIEIEEKIQHQENLNHINKLEEEKKELELKIKELMDLHQKSTIDIKNTLYLYQTKYQNEEKRVRDLVNQLENLTDEKKQLIRKHVKDLQQQEENIKGKLIHLKRPSTNLELNLSTEVNLSIQNYSIAVQTKKWNENDFEEETFLEIPSSPTSIENNLEITAEHPTNYTRKSKPSWKVEKRKTNNGQQTSPRLLNIYVKDHAKQFTHLFPKQKPKIVTTLAYRPPKNQINFIQKNAQSVSDIIDPNSTRKFVEALIQSSEENRNTSTPDMIVHSFNTTTHSSINLREDQKKWINKPKSRPATTPKFQQIPSKIAEHDIQRPITRANLSDYLNINDKEENENIIKIESELKPPVSIVELIENTEKPPMKVSDMIRLTTDQIHIQKDIESFEKMLSKERLNLETHYKKKIKQLKEQHLELKAKLESSELNPQKEKALRKDIKQSLKQKYETLLNQLNSKIESQKQQISLLEKSINGINILSFTPLVDAIHNVVAMENSVYGKITKQSNRPQTSFGNNNNYGYNGSNKSIQSNIRPTTSYSYFINEKFNEFNSNSESSHSRQQIEFGNENTLNNEIQNEISTLSEPLRIASIDTNSIDGDKEAIIDHIQSNIDLTWMRVIGMIRSLVTTKTLSKLSTIHFDRPTDYSKEQIDIDLRTQEMNKGFKPKLRVRTAPKVVRSRKNDDNLAVVSLPYSSQKNESSEMQASLTSNPIQSIRIPDFRKNEVDEDTESEEELDEQMRDVNREIRMQSQTTHQTRMDETKNDSFLYVPSSRRESEKQSSLVPTEEFKPDFPNLPPSQTHPNGFKVTDAIARRSPTRQQSKSLDLPSYILEMLQSSLSNTNFNQFKNSTFGAHSSSINYGEELDLIQSKDRRRAQSNIGFNTGPPSLKPSLKLKKKKIKRKIQRQDIQPIS